MNSPAILKNLRPYWGRVAVIESAVDEEERDSGLIVPLELEGVKRGMVIALDDHWLEHVSGYKNDEVIPVGTVVYFRHGTKIGDTFILDCDQIMAYEAAE